MQCLCLQANSVLENITIKIFEMRKVFFRETSLQIAYFNCFHPKSKIAVIYMSLTWLHLVNLSTDI